MANISRLAVADGFDGGSPLPPETKPLFVVPWFDRGNAEMPYVYSLHEFNSEAETFVFETPVAGRELTDFVGNFSKEYGLIVNGKKIPLPEKPSLSVRFCGFFLIDLSVKDPVFDLIQEAHNQGQKNGLLVTTSVDDPNRRVAARMECLLKSSSGLVARSVDGQLSFQPCWPVFTP